MKGLIPVATRHPCPHASPFFPSPCQRKASTILSVCLAQLASRAAQARAHANKVIVAQQRTVARTRSKSWQAWREWTQNASVSHRAVAAGALHWRHRAARFALGHLRQVLLPLVWLPVVGC